MTIRSTIAFFATLAVLGTVPAVAAATPDTLALAAAKKKHVVRHRPAVAPQGEIACGPWGCQRIPPNCHTAGSQLDWHGNPTGADAVYCH